MDKPRAPKYRHLAAADKGETELKRKLRPVPYVVRHSFLLFIMLLPFEPIGLGLTGGSLSVTRLFEPLFLASFYFFFNPFAQKRSFPIFPSALWCFLLYTIVTITSALLLPPESRQQFSRAFLKLVEMILFLWAASYLFKDEMLAKRGLIAYAVSSVVLAIVTALAVAGFDHGDAERETIMGMNANNAAMWMAVPATVLIGLSIHPGQSIANGIFWQLLRKRAVLLGLALPTVIMLVLTGSRAGMLALGIGCVTYVFATPKIKQRFTAVCLATIALIGLIYFVSTNEYILERWESFISEGNTSGRTLIWTVGFEMFLEKPLVGWQPIEYYFEVGRRIGRLGKGMDAHNMVLQLLLEVGLLGFLPFITGLWLCFRGAWKTRLRTLGPIPFAVLTTVTVGSLSAPFLDVRFFWLALALGIAASMTAADQRNRPPVRLLGRRAAVQRRIAHGILPNRID
jgi:O-antigen ligase